MPSIVLDSFSRASIRFEKLATQEADRLADLQISGEINIKEAQSVPFKAGADRLTSKISYNEFEISKADKYIGSLENSLNAIDHMRDMVEQITDLEKVAATESDLTLSASYIEQADELKEQIIKMGENATFRGLNMFSTWGQETFHIAGQNFSAISVDLDDIISGLAYRGGNVLNIQDGDFDTSAYPNLVSAYGADVINNVYTDFTGNYPDGQVLNGAAIGTNGPGGNSSIDLLNPQTNRTTGSHVQVPAFSLPSNAFSIGVWARMDTSGRFNRIFDFSNDSATNGPGGNGLILTRFRSTDRMRAYYNYNAAGPGWDVIADSGGGAIVNGEWAYWMVTLEEDGLGNVTLSLYKDGNQLSQSTAAGSVPAATLTENYFGAADWNGDDTMSGGISDYVVFDEALDTTEAMDWYQGVGVTGLEKSFFTMSSEKIEDTLDKLEAHYETVKIGVEMQRDQLIFKNELYADEITTLMSIDTEEVAVQSNLAQMRQTLAVTSLGITSSSQANILNLFG